MDFGEASTIGEEENTVRIMSIHKSKGLEFPVVFVAGLGKVFNRQDARSTIAIHQNYGVGCDVVDPLLRTKAPTILKKAIQQILLTESLGEELRVLYVAVTRAKEKLYLSGSLKKMEDTLSKWSGGAGKKQLSYLEIKNAASMLEWILRSVLYEEGIQSEIPIRKYSVDDLYREKLDEENHGDTILQQFRDHLFEKEEGYAAFLAWMTQESAKIYPYEGRLEIQGKCSVSEIKRQSQIQEQKEEADTDAKSEESEESVETQEEAQKEAKEPEAGEEQKNQETDANSQVPETGNGKKIAIDPGHQGYNVDMSAQEPMGRGSSEMKAKATTGTQGCFTGVREYELNLNISKQLREELKNRGYEVMLTREDNDTAISNKERAELATQYGADIYVRIHANGTQ